MLYKDGGQAGERMASVKRRRWEVEGSSLAGGEMGRGRMERIQHGEG